MRQFIESLKRLYKNQSINKDKIVELYDNGKINVDEKNYILNVE
jgi:hypothetical protein